ncbi:MAG TPA: DUF885 domain-containing protein [Bryobacteraceae bacterium]|jgi:uncharacterized protein (DUF885 family)|nr:DUF885 domain-containing protein [Bryobacteraceae bacterium]
MATLLTAVEAQTAYDRFFDEYYFPSSPTTATSAGIHKYDDKLEDYSKAGVAKRAATLKKFESEFAKLPESPDRDLVLSNIRAELLELETVRGWERNPDNYSSGITNSAFVIMSRTFAPPEARLKSLTARERLMPKVLAEARANLKNPPRIFTEVAIEQIPGNISFFENDVPLAFKAVTDHKLLADFQTANKAVIAALKEYEQWMTKDLLPRSQGDFRLGPATYAKKLDYEEMVDIPLERLLEIGYADLHKNQKAFAETAARIDSTKTPQQILAEMEKDHPSPDKLLDAFRDTLGGLTKFIEDHKIVTIPSPVPPILEETPPFMRALTFASMDTPGPYETVAKEAFFNVTLPEKDWPKDRVDDFMGAFNRGTILSTAIHEAYPGHYVQFLWMQHVDSKVRKLLGANSNAEGWAHYSEQMMLDEGYTNGDPRMRLGQLQDALLRDARYIVGIEMHTGKRTFDQGIEFFEKEGYQTHETAVRETKRGTSDPTYLYYTLGKLQIMKLRDDYRAKKGAAFSLEEFHDNFMKQGFPPIKIVRKALLGDDSPTL